MGRMFLLVVLAVVAVWLIRRAIVHASRMKQGDGPQAGKPPVTLQAGGSFLIPAGTVHNATNTGAGKGRILATYIVEKGKPLATPAK